MDLFLVLGFNFAKKVIKATVVRRHHPSLFLCIEVKDLKYYCFMISGG